MTYKTITIIHRHSEQSTHCQPDACFSSHVLFWQTATVSLTFVCIQSTVDINWIWMIYAFYPDIRSTHCRCRRRRYASNWPQTDVHRAVCVSMSQNWLSFFHWNTCSYFIRSSIKITQNYLETNIFSTKAYKFHITVQNILMVRALSLQRIQSAAVALFRNDDL